MSSSFNRKDYTQRDYDSLRTALIAYIQAKYPTLNISFSDASVESLLADFVLFPADGLHLYIDAGLSEGFVDTAVDRANLASQGKLVGYTLSGRSAALATLTYTYTKLVVGAPVTVNLSRGQALRSKDGLTFSVVSTGTVLTEAGGTFDVYQGVFATDTFVATTNPGQRFTATRKKIAQNVAVVVKVAGVDWTQVTALLGAGVGNFYLLQWNGDGSFTTVFGDGTDGNIPAGTITVEYFLTDGTAGQLGENRVEGNFKPDTQVRIDYTNDDDTTGGADEVAIADIRAAIPAYGSSQNNLCAFPDYQGHFEAYPGILYASLSYDPVLRRSVVYLLADGYGPLSETTLGEMDRYFKDRLQLGSSLLYKNVDFVGARVAVNVSLTNSLRYDTTSKQSEIQSVIERFFEPLSTDPVYNRVGVPIRLSDLYERINNLEGVEYLTVTCFTREPQLSGKTWSAAAGSIALGTWYLRPAVGLRKQPTGGNRTRVPGVGTMPEFAPLEQGQRISRITTASRSNPVRRGILTRVTGGVLASDEWQVQPIVVPIDYVKLTMSNMGRRYAWGSWFLTDDGLVPEPFLTRDPEVGVQTAHFVVSHFVDGVEYPDSTIGYVGKVFEVDSGSFMFDLTATSTAYTGVALSQQPLTSSDYTWWKVPYRFIKPGSITGTIMLPATLSKTVTDDGCGGLLVGKVLAGFIDYDTGDILVKKASVRNILTFTIGLRVYSFPNMPGEKAEMVISPYVGDIPVGVNEFCALSDLTVEVGYA